MARMRSTVAALVLRRSKSASSLGLAQMLGRPSKCAVKSLLRLRGVPSGQLQLKRFNCVLVLLTIFTSSKGMLLQCLQIKRAAAIIGF